jgi:flagellin
MAMNAYRNYNNNTSALSGNLEKLSSGYKINRAGDDAAGLAISEKMRAQISGLEQASSNVKDGISLVKTGEGAMQEVQDMLNRMVTLATQSANGTYDDETDRANLQKEVDALKSEINRIADSSNFNGINLLDGSLDDSFKVTGEEDAVDASALTVVSDGQLGNDPQAGVFELDLTDFSGTGTANTAVSVSIFGTSLSIDTPTAAKTYSGTDLAKAITSQFNTNAKTSYAGSGTGAKDYGVKTITAKQEGSKVIFTMSNAPIKAWDEKADVTITGLNNTNNTATPGNTSYDLQLTTVKSPVDSSAGRQYAQATVDLTKAGIADGSTLTIGDTTYTFAVGSDSAFKDYDNVIDLTDMTADEVDTAAKNTMGEIAARVTTAAQDNKNFSVTSNTAVGTTNGLGTISLTEKEGGVDTTNYTLGGDKANTANSKDGDWTGFVKFGKVDTASMGTALSLQIGDTAKDYNQLKVTIDDIHTTNLGIDDVDVSTQEGATAAIDKIKAAINQVSSTRGDLGAVQNRLEHTANNLSVMTENIQDAESTIRDTDIAEEMMSYTKNSILVQSAQAMLAQANTVPQGVLQLLQ